MKLSKWSLPICILLYFSSCLKQFSKLSVLNNLIMMCLGVVFFLFTVLGVCWDFLISKIIIFCIFEECLPILLSDSPLILSLLDSSYTVFIPFKFVPQLTNAVYFSIFSICVLFWLTMVSNSFLFSSAMSNLLISLSFLIM